MGKQDFVVGPGWKGTPSPTKVSHGCVTPVAYTGATYYRTEEGIRRLGPERSITFPHRRELRHGDQSKMLGFPLGST
jgi:hypothetical protein